MRERGENKSEYIKLYLRLFFCQKKPWPSQTLRAFMISWATHVNIFFCNPPQEFGIKGKKERKKELSVSVWPRKFGRKTVRKKYFVCLLHIFTLATHNLPRRKEGRGSHIMRIFILLVTRTAAAAAETNGTLPTFIYLSGVLKISCEKDNGRAMEATCSGAVS